jgi:hypothetical protein
MEFLKNTRSGLSFLPVFMHSKSEDKSKTSLVLMFDVEQQSSRDTGRVDSQFARKA